MCLRNTLHKRRRQLAEKLPGTAVLFTSGELRIRSYPADPYSFHANSHYLYFGGAQEPGLALLLRDGEATLFRDPQSDEDRLWHGAKATSEELAERYLYNEVCPLAQLKTRLAEFKAGSVLSLPHADLASQTALCAALGRRVDHREGPDLRLARAVVESRLYHDESARERMRSAVDNSVGLQKAIWEAVEVGASERSLRAAHDCYLASEGLGVSFTPILTVRGEVLHNHEYDGRLGEDDLVLIDCGAALSDGWSGDLTRTVPASGRFSPTQRSLYEVVNEARRAAIEAAKPGVFFRDLHFLAAATMLEGLKELKIFKGSTEQLLERRAHTLFFPHGLGHLLGLDAHDMEDLGDLAGYEEGEVRSSEFGTSALRLARHLNPTMVVTIEPGFYRIPQLLDSEFGRSFDDLLDRAVLERYSDVRGIRIEDDILITEHGNENLSGSLPTSIEEVEAYLQGGS